MDYTGKTGRLRYIVIKTQRTMLKEDFISFSSFIHNVLERKDGIFF